MCREMHCGTPIYAALKRLGYKTTKYRVQNADVKKKEHNMSQL